MGKESQPSVAVAVPVKGDAAGPAAAHQNNNNNKGGNQHKGGGNNKGGRGRGGKGRGGRGGRGGGGRGKGAGKGGRRAGHGVDHGGGVYGKGGGKGPRMRGSHVGPGTFGCGRLGMLFFAFRFLSRRMGCGKKNKHKKQGQSPATAAVVPRSYVRVSRQSVLRVCVGAEIAVGLPLAWEIISDAMSFWEGAFDESPPLGPHCPLPRLRS